MSNAIKFGRAFKGELIDEFTKKHLTGNLLGTTEYKFDDRHYEIHIPAREYDMPLYIRKGIFNYRGSKSYALRLNEEGSTIYIIERRSQGRWIKRSHHLGNHKGYIDKCINAGIRAVKGKRVYDDK